LVLLSLRRGTGDRQARRIERDHSVRCAFGAARIPTGGLLAARSATGSAAGPTAQWTVLKVIR